MMPALGLTVVLVSWPTYNAVERSGIACGKRLYKRWNMRSRALWGASLARGERAAASRP